jgi:DNA invertase Pin-like site-specific DNA recombinase
MTLRCATYARFSTNKQTPISIEDQIRKCREFAEAKGWKLIEDQIYADEAVSGAGADRDGLKQLLASARSVPRIFDVILVDDTSRLSRNVGDAARIREELGFLGVRIVAVSQGIDSQDEQAEVLFGVHALVDTIYIKELGKKTHRGLEGLALRGLHTGGNCYGYRNVRIEDGVKLEVNESQAGVIRRIFEMAASGQSLKKIAKTLNSENISPPRPRANKQNITWCPTAIHAMLRREMYIGRVIWNRSRFMKSPGSNKRVRRPRPRSEWKVFERSDLRIVSDDLWKRVQDRLAWTKKIYGRQHRDGLLNRAASSQYLFSGIVKCSLCGGNLVITSGRSRRGHRRYGCSQHFYRGVCPNGVQIRKDWLEEKLLGGLQDSVLKPEVVKYAVEEFSRQLEKSDSNLSHEMDRAAEKKRNVEAELNRLVAAVADGGHSPSLLKAIEQREQELQNLNEQLQASGAGSQQMQPADITSFVINRLAALRDLLNSDVTQARAELLKHVTEIRLYPKRTEAGTDYVAVGEWNLLGNYPEMDRARHLQGVRARLVAGVGFEPTTFGL